VKAVFYHFFTCEMTTMGSKSGQPVTWPVMPLFWADRGQFVLLTSIGLPQKAFNVRRHPRVSLLFSDPTGSELPNPPTVLVQGEAKAPDDIVAAIGGLDPELLKLVKTQALRMLELQPAMKMYLRNGLTRYLMDWYFMRLVITVTPHRILWWETGDRSAPPIVREVNDVV
jgi:hypothetical protein